jgi:hypothetical protein
LPSTITPGLRHQTGNCARPQVHSREGPGAKPGNELVQARRARPVPPHIPGGFSLVPSPEWPQTRFAGPPPALSNGGRLLAASSGAAHSTLRERRCASSQVVRQTDVKSQCRLVAIDPGLCRPEPNHDQTLMVSWRILHYTVNAPMHSDNPPAPKMAGEERPTVPGLCSLLRCEIAVLSGVWFGNAGIAADQCGERLFATTSGSAHQGCSAPARQCLCL